MPRGSSTQYMTNETKTIIYTIKSQKEIKTTYKTKSAQKDRI